MAHAWLPEPPPSLPPPREGATKSAPRYVGGSRAPVHRGERRFTFACALVRPVLHEIAAEQRARMLPRERDARLQRALLAHSHEECERVAEVVALDDLAGEHAH